jgi:MFS family permease
LGLESRAEERFQTGELLGLINTTYSIGAIVAGWFLGGPIVSMILITRESGTDVCEQADALGRRAGMGIGCFITVIATFVQTFAPQHKVGVFIFGRVLIGLGQGMALSRSSNLESIFLVLTKSPKLRGLSTLEK